MADISKQYLDYAGLSTYDGLIKTWANSANQIAYKTVAKSADGNSLLFFNKPNAVVGTDTADATIPMGSADAAAQLAALASKVGATWDSVNGVYTISLDSSLEATNLVAAINEVIADFNTFIGEIPNGATATTVIGYIAEKVAAEINALDGSATIASKTGDIVTIKTGVTEADGVISNDNGTDIELAAVASTGAAADVTVADANNKITAANVEDALEELVDAIADATDASKVTCETTAGSNGSDTLTTYSFYQGVLAGDDATAKAAKKIVDINIPKDYVVRSADVEVVETADTPYSGAVVGEKYIDLGINTNDGTGSGTVRHLYIPFKDLMDAVKGSTGAEITVAVASDNTISATINKVASTKIVYVAESGTSGQAGYQPEVTVKDALDTLNGADTVAGSVAKAQKDAIDTVVGANSDTASADTVNGAKAYADDAIDTAVTGLATATDVAIATNNTSTGAFTIQGSIAETDGVVEAGTADTITVGPIADATIQNLFS